MISFLLNITDPLPKIQNYEDIGLKSFLIFVILVLLGAVYKLWKKNEALNDKISDIKDVAWRDLLDMAEKSFSVISSQREELLANHGQISEKTIEVITKGQEAIKAMLEKIKERIGQ